MRAFGVGIGQWNFPSSSSIVACKWGWGLKDEGFRTYKGVVVKIRVPFGYPK